jgi:asparagine synthase (glutamine-hydrolysing)
MCGIAGIVLKSAPGFNIGEKIVLMCDALSHRGPDGEGFMLSSGNNSMPFYNVLKSGCQRWELPYIPELPLSAGMPDALLAFGHRRLSIIDLSEAGHQPMCDTAGQLWITFNGEIYNYIEVRNELKLLGHNFVSQCDTEIVLLAYKAWGFKCVEKFNGMWAFCIYDASRKLCFASRDRLGVKPFYYINKPKLFSFASEQKAFTRSGLIVPGINRKALTDYLVSNLPENTQDNFFEGISELMPGNNLVYELESQEVKITRYYDLRELVNNQNDVLTENELVERIRSAFNIAVSLRLRSDVEVGTCLSGGIDSSALAVTISEINRRPLHCFTSVFNNLPINEDHYATLIAEKIGAKHFRVEPSLEEFLKEADTLVYSQDTPIWDTSTFAQYKVMELAKLSGIKVVLDGQGADELFAGYHHHFIAKWNNLIRQGKNRAAIKGIMASRKTIANPLFFFVKERLKEACHLNHKSFNRFFNPDFIAPSLPFDPLYCNDVNSQLLDDIYHTRLKSFLKCEDRCGMWHSVESRTPFSDDVNLINLMFSFDGNKKIQNGISKYLLREAVKDKLPAEIYKRYDKKGFETPMQQWVRKMRPLLVEEINAAKFDFLEPRSIQKSNPSNVFDNKMLFKLFIIARWKKIFRD